MPATRQEQIALTVIDRWFAHRCEMREWMGAQIALRRRGELIFSNAYGVANGDTGQKLTRRHLGHFASHSKMFTACALLRLQEAGQVTLDAKLTGILTELYTHKDRRVRDISLRDLLSHRAGFVRDGLSPDYWEGEIEFPDAAALMQESKQASLVYAPNTITKYSNTGYGLLGAVIERVTGVPYVEHIRREVLARTGLGRVEPDYRAACKLPYADGHGRTWKGAARLPLVHMPARALAAATGFCATAEDMSQFLSAYLCGDQLVSAATQTELRALDWPVANSTIERYGLGLTKYAFDGGWLTGHTGGYPGFNSATLQSPDGTYTVSLYVNNAAVLVPTAKSVLKLLALMADLFDEREAARVEVSPPLHCLWGSELFVVGRKQALEFVLDSSAPHEEWCVLQRAGNGYKTDKKNGFRNIGQAIEFRRDKAGRIVATAGMGTSMVTAAAFEGRLSKTRLSRKGRKISS